ncbi:hypothetical protein GCM10009548_37380 [Streptomyces malaysiensis subsp. malaysiensis]
MCPAGRHRPAQREIRSLRGMGSRRGMGCHGQRPDREQTRRHKPGE